MLPGLWLVRKAGGVIQNEAHTLNVENQPPQTEAWQQNAHAGVKAILFL